MLHWWPVQQRHRSAEGIHRDVYHNVADGLQLKTEYPYDWSNQPVFLTSHKDVFRKDQSTATLGMIWWFGRKQGAW